MQNSYHKTRGYEMACSLDYMVSIAGGGKQAWRKAILKLCALGLLKQYRPRSDEDYICLNTLAQNYSVARTDAKKRYPVTWYSVPEYTEALLEHANEQAATVIKYGSGIDKDGLRYHLGAKEANRICDTGYPKAAWRKAMEKAILSAIQEQVKENGYTTLESVLKASQKLTTCNEHQILSTWKSYRHQLHSEMGICYARPSKQQMAMFNLKDGKWIITKK